MSPSYPHLLSPLTVGGVTFRNRIFSAPMTLHSLQGSEPHPTEALITHYANKARGGAGCVTCAGVSIFPVGQDLSGHARWDAYDAPNVHYLAQLSQRIHFYGARASMELGVAGVAGGEYGASDGITLMAGNIAREMPESEMERIADGYAATALAVRNAGFDMVLLHFGHGLLVGQFLSPLTNKRSDAYGGALANRARFPMMIIDRIRDKVGRRLLIEVRISGSEIAPGGITIEEAIEFTRMVQDRIDLIHVSAGMHVPRYFTVTHPCGFLPPMPNVRFAEAVKKAGVHVPVVAIGGIQELNGAEKILAEGRADAVSIARGLIADPWLGEKALEGRAEDVRPCIKCMRCHDSAVYENAFVCTVNPTIGLEHALSSILRAPDRKKKVVVIGGGPSGMLAALTAHERGHNVTLFEKAGSLGGVLAFSDKVDFKYDLQRYKDYLVRHVMSSGISVKLRTTATPQMVKKLGADVVVAALGAVPVVPRIPGVDGPTVVMALASYGMEDRLGGRIAVIGGGQVGCETALHLARLGRTVTVLEMQKEAAPDASPTHRTELLFELEDSRRVALLTSALCEQITASGVLYRDSLGQAHSVQADHVIIAVGLRSREEEASSFRGAAPRFFSVGDCTRPATVEHATRAAFAAASQI